MDTPLGTRQGGAKRTVFRSNIRPRMVQNQEQLSSLIVAPATVRLPSPDTTFATPVKTPLDRTSTVGTAPADVSALLSTLDRTGWSFRVEHAVNEIIREHNARQQSMSVYSDLQRLFEATMDTVITIASGETPSDEHLLWSEAFLRAVRDHYGNHPPNVRKMLGFIRALRDKRESGSGADTSQLFVQTYYENVPANVTLTKIPPPTV